MNSCIETPFPYFGNKRRAAAAVWERFGNPPNYVEPFAGSCAVLLRRPRPFRGEETINDLDGMVCNFWRAVAWAPEEVVRWVDWPVIENDKHARQAWLTNEKKTLQALLEGNPKYFDAQIAGWWVWGMCVSIAQDFCRGPGPWQMILDESGAQRLVKSIGREGISRTIPMLAVSGSKGIRKDIQYLHTLADRFREVRVACGDWRRVLTPGITTYKGITAVFLDPPYSAEAMRDNDMYACESTKVAHDAAAWAIANGDNPSFRIAMCGYEGEHVFPPSWENYAWTALKGYANKNKENANRRKERIYFSPFCLKGGTQLELPL